MTNSEDEMMDSDDLLQRNQNYKYWHEQRERDDEIQQRKDDEMKANKEKMMKCNLEHVHEEKENKCGHM